MIHPLLLGGKYFILFLCSSVVFHSDVKLYYFHSFISVFHHLGYLTQTAKVTIHKLKLLYLHFFSLKDSADRSLRARESSLFHNLRFSYIHLSLWNSFGDARWAPGIIVIANPDIIELQSDRATPGAARTITLRPGSRWKSCIRGKTSVYQMLKNREVLADNVSIPTKVITAGLRGGLTLLY